MKCLGDHFDLGLGFTLAKLCLSKVLETFE